MPKIRVLVVDDAVVMRRLITEALARDPDIEVVGAAAHGRIALARIPQLNPDVITLDVEMPEMDGIETVRAIRKDYPNLPVIMFSTLTERGASATLDALAAGATDYVTKPANVGSVGLSLQRLEEELSPKIRLHARHLLKPAPATFTAAPIAASARPPTAARPAAVAPPGPVELMCLGCSTGGPNALSTVFTAIQTPIPVPIVIVQHMPVLFTKMLAERLDKVGSVRFVEGDEGMAVQPGHAYIAPGGRHMEVVTVAGVLRLRLHDQPPENSCRPAVDVLFRSVAAACGGNVLGVMLTGMGQDGLHGCRHLRERHAQIIAQDEKTSVVWGMPGVVAQAGLADRVLPLDQIAPEITRRLTARARTATLSPALPSSLNATDFDFISSFAHSSAAIVLERGKEYLVESRLAPLAQREGFDSLGSMVNALRSNRTPGPLHAKAIDALTTNETYFFRDFHPFEALRKKILPEMIAKRAEAKKLTVWCAACSTGQEPYSIAMMIREQFPALATWKIEIIGTDLSPTVLKQAEAGRYNQIEVNRGLPAMYLIKYFEQKENAWIIKPDIRSMVSFRPLNLITPWPILPSCDLIFIRNVMIYFDVETKKSILKKMRNCLRPDGSLFLGSSETTLNLDPFWNPVTEGTTVIYRPVVGAKA